MEREQIVRDDFPTVRKGWDPDAVRDHLRAVADAARGPEPDTPLADQAAERVRSVIAAAEEAASEIGAQARAEADRLLAEAREEAERTRGRAREEADVRVEQARAAVEGLVAQADELRTKVGTLGEELAGKIRESTDSIGGGGARAEVPGPVTVPEPGPARVPEPTPDPVPEPTPEPSPEPIPDPVPEPTPDPVPEPTPDPVPDQPAAGEVSTEDLIAQLRNGSGEGAPAANGSSEAPAGGADVGAARLVAMNLALDGKSREEISAQLRTEFGDDEALDGVLDDVLARAGR